MSAVSRRDFLSISAAAWLASRSRAVAFESPLAGQVVAGKDPALRVVESAPIVLETPLSQLAGHQLTPIPSLFVRNNQDLPGANSIEPPANADEWKLTIDAAAGGPRQITAAQLRQLPQTSVEMVLQCSGNSRYRFAETVPVSGTPWGDGGVGNVEFGGVRLTTVLEHLGIEPSSTARFLLAEGADGPVPGKPDFEHSLPLNDCLSRSLVALTLNGQPLPAIHGGPLRLITPGYFGTMQLKWLSRMAFADEESSNSNHASRYRMPLTPLQPGAKFNYSLANSRASWKMNIKSVILCDADSMFPADRELAISGVAFNDGECPLETVLISLDRGESWKPVPLEPGSSPYAWSRWTARLTLPAGPHEVWSRAIDERGRTQPLDGRQLWNPAGYEFNAVDRRKIMVTG